MAITTIMRLKRKKSEKKLVKDSVVSESTLDVCEPPTLQGPDELETSDLPRNSRRPTRLFAVLSNWGWELASMLLSVSCMAAIVGILFSIQGKRLEDWKLPIQPNSCVAVFSTVAKSALLYPIAECIGQLKWSYFETVRGLYQMQTFDEASRGPWGSAKLCWHVGRRGRAVLATVAALVTVLVFLFEPFAQQVIHLSTKETLLRDRAGSVSRASTWNAYNTVLSVHELDATVFYALTSKLYNPLAQLNHPIVSNTHCPSNYCNISEVESIAVCADCTSAAFRFDIFDHCPYYLTLEDGRNRTRSAWYGNETRPTDMGLAFIEATMRKYEFSTMVFHCEKRTRGEYLNLSLDVHLNRSSIFMRWIWSADTMKTSVDVRLRNTDWIIFNTCIGKFEIVPMEGQGIFICLNITNEKKLTIAQWKEMDILRGTVTFCRPKICVKKYHDLSIRGNEVQASRTERIDINITWASNLDKGDGLKPISRPSAFPAKVHLSYHPFRILKTLSDVVNSYEYFSVVRNQNSREAMRHGSVERVTNWTQRFEEMASICSGILQGRFNPNSTNVSAAAYGDAVFIDVHWVWMGLPLSLVVFSVLVLVSTMLESSRKRYLLKTSILAVLYHGLEEGDLDGDELLDAKKMRKRSQRTSVKFGETNNGTLKLKLKGQ
ncbi:hypothetical protein B0J11DRAFT_584137 [Dendryphion nanum]|uniref:Uncharacterized protein n=1 Tax=Dendryphion nanum TaxID=256645 RepID=A0A9P9IDS6_9PLEO|nr:hypothetical protein B0J11DRAFT_584137 [Dendryphion nanum]